MTNLTRWNRAGLARFRYVDANAATHLETLRAALAARFPDWETVQSAFPTDESPGDRTDRLLAQYYSGRLDLVWETARTLARASHVLTEHLDAFANEGYLGTATQWENVRRLVRMLDYSPAPPASASASIVITAKDGVAETLPTGFQIKYAPADGSAAIVFETLQDLDLDDDLNEIRISGWDSSAALSEGAEWIVGQDQDVSAGQVGLVVSGDNAAAVDIDAVDGVSRAATLTDQPGWSSWPRGEVVLLAGPADIRSPQLNGAGLIYAEAWTGIGAGDVLAWQDNGWHADEVVEVEGTALRLKTTESLQPNIAVYRPARIVRSADGSLVVPATSSPTVGVPIRAISTPEVPAGSIPTSGGTRRVMFRRSTSGIEELASFTAADYTFGDDDTPQEGYQILTDPVLDEVFIIKTDTAPVATTTSSTGTSSGITFDGSPGPLAAGDWVVVEDATATRYAVRILSITEVEDSFTVAFDIEGPPWSASGLVRLYGPFKYEIRPTGWDRNTTGLTGKTLQLDVDSLPGLLLPGRVLMLEQENAARDGFENAVKVTIDSTASDPPAIVIDRELDTDDGFTFGNTVVRANVVQAGHGAVRPQKVLGSGDATQSGQSFTLEVDGVSFVEDASFAAGVRADLDLSVDSVTWTPVDSLNDSAPEDAHYTVRMDEDGHLLVTFGDGTHGRRLPTGSNNVRALFRVGAGLAGNLGAQSLESIVRPGTLVASVRQPLEATGGAEAEDAASVRENAPASVLTLSRAVSLSDFASLAAGLSSVWQAAAFEAPGGRRGATLVVVVVVPAGGGELGDLEDTIRTTLESHALPGLQILVTGFTPRPFTAAVTISVDSAAYDPDEVRQGVTDALRAAFALSERRLGQHLYLSEVISVIEEVEGVENADCILNADTTLQVVQACGRCVVSLDDSDAALQVTTQEYTL